MQTYRKAPPRIGTVAPGRRRKPGLIEHAMGSRKRPAKQAPKGRRY